MATTSRATLPAEFFDITTAQLLIQPEPMYLHATLAKNALAVSLEPDTGLGLPVQGRQFGENGAPYSPVGIDRLILGDPLAGGAVKVIPDFGAHAVPGHVVRINRPAFVNSTYTAGSREVPSGTTISTTGISLSSEQVSLTLKRYAGLYDNGQSVPAPLAVDRFDASLSLHKMSAIKDKTLKRDFDRFLDTVMIQLFDSAANVIYPRGIAADADFKTAGDGPFDYTMVLDAAAKLDNLSVPTFPNGNRVMIISPDQAKQLSQDRQYAALARQNTDFNTLYQGIYVSTVGNFDIFKSPQLTQNLGVTTPVRYAQAFGPGMVGIGCGGMPYTAYNSQDNYGETALVIWLWYAAFGALDNRFGLSLRSN